MIGQPEIVSDSIMRQSARASWNRLPSTFDWRIWGPFCATIAHLRDGHGMHRKSWEFATCIQGLDALLPPRPEFKAFATGAGCERPLYHYANVVLEMHATDLYDLSHPEGQPSMLSNPSAHAPFPFRESHLFVQRMDGRNLDFRDGQFDFGFSLSSIEHFGTREEQRHAFSEMIRVTRPGGVLCVVTELILNDARHEEYFSPEELNEVFFTDPRVKLVGGEPDLRVQQSLFDYPCDLRDSENVDKSPHLVLTDGQVIWTSFSMFFQRLED